MGGFMRSIKRLTFCFLLLFSFFAVLAGTSKYMKPATSLLEPTEDKALVRFMRPSGMGFAVEFNILDGEKVIGNLDAKSQFDYLAEAGKHLFIAAAENKVFLEADLEAGKTYYILARIYTGAWKARVAFVAVNKGSEFWDKVKEYEKELKMLAPNTEELQKWQDANIKKIKNIISNYETELKNREAWPKLNPEDGR